MFYLTCTMISSVDLAHYVVSRAKDGVSVVDFPYARFRAILHQYRRSVTFAVEAIDKTVYVRVMQNKCFEILLTLGKKSR